MNKKTISKLVDIRGKLFDLIITDEDFFNDTTNMEFKEIVKIHRMLKKLIKKGDEK